MKESGRAMPCTFLCECVGLSVSFVIVKTSRNDFASWHEVKVDHDF